MRVFEYRYDVSKRLSIVFSRWQGLEHDRTQKKFAEKIGVDRKAVVRWLSGETLPKAEQIYQICLLCQCSADWLLGLSRKENNR